jgi:hypothetical protein
MHVTLLIHRSHSLSYRSDCCYKCFTMSHQCSCAPRTFKLHSKLQTTGGSGIVSQVEWNGEEPESGAAVSVTKSERRALRTQNNFLLTRPKLLVVASFVILPYWLCEKTQENLNLKSRSPRVPNPEPFTLIINQGPQYWNHPLTASKHIGYYTYYLLLYICQLRLCYIRLLN